MGLVAYPLSGILIPIPAADPIHQLVSQVLRGPGPPCDCHHARDKRRQVNITFLTGMSVIEAELSYRASATDLPAPSFTCLQLY